MATYPGMNLRGEVRESISLDEDDLSDVEDEVFIRDGKTGFKFEDVSVKKPLMAPRRKTGRSEFSKHIKNQPPCRAVGRLWKFCNIKHIILGLIVLVVILVSLFPLPLDKLKYWFFNTTNEEKPITKLIPCSYLKVTDVWTVNFPKLISESPVQMVDINQDGVDDVIFGFGTSDDETLPSELFCNMFLGVPPPCQGGIIALNGTDGSIIWRHWLPHSVFTLFCTVDINFDNVTDCLISGKGGIFSVINGFNGTAIWTFHDKSKDASLVIDVYWPNFIPDLDNDTVPDILASYTSQKGGLRVGSLIVVSGKTGVELQRVSTPESLEIYYIPQLLKQSDGNYSVLFGTGSPTVPGNLSIIPLNDVLLGNMTPQTLYQDSFKGVFSSAVLVDITGDGYPDIVSAMFNTTVVAIDGNSLQQIWNFTIPNSQTLSVPIPAYFNNDNVTDFLIKYQTGSDFPTYYYSQTFIINGKTGKPIYNYPIVDSVGSQMGGLTLAMEAHGFDFFLYWMADCKNFEGNQESFEFMFGSKIQQQTKADLCKLRFNSSMVVKLQAINQYEQPPGIEIYNSDNRATLEYNNTKLPINEAKEYLKLHPEIQYRQSNNEQIGNEELNINQDYDQAVDTFRNVKYKDGSSFRHKSNGQGLIRDFSDDNKRHKSVQTEVSPKYENDYDAQSSDNWHHTIPDDLDNDYNTYIDEGDRVYSKPLKNSNNRDPRSKSADEIDNKSDDIGKSDIYGYKNVQRARTRLLHDLNDLPSDILRDAFFKNREHQLRKSRFEQRDLKADSKESDIIKKVIDKEKKTSFNNSETLWDLESEKETEDKESGYWRGKRQTNSSTMDNTYSINGIPKITSIGALTSSLNTTRSSIDLVFLTYWLPPKNAAQILLKQDIKCINEKFKKAIDTKAQLTAFKKASMQDLFQKQCLEERGVHFKQPPTDVNKEDTQSPLLKQIAQLSLGQMTIYRLQLECVCSTIKKGEKCVQFLKPEDQNWASYLGKIGDGVFKTRN